jgi:hypothetical protein
MMATALANSKERGEGSCKIRYMHGKKRRCHMPVIYERDKDFGQDTSSAQLILMCHVSYGCSFTLDMKWNRFRLNI